MSTGSVLQSPSTTTISQITGKRKRVDSAAGAENAGDNQENGKRREDIYELLVNIFEVLKK